MAVLTYAQGIILAQERAGVYVESGVDSPFNAAAILRYVNESLADLWEASGGRLRSVASATAWTSAQGATGVVTGILTDVGEVVHIWAATSSGSVGLGATDQRLDPVPLAHIKHMRSHGEGLPTYLVPKVYCITRMLEADQLSGTNNLVRLDYWPSVTGFYFPMEYVPQFVEMDGGASDVPPLNDIETRDMYLLAAKRMSQLAGREHLVPGIMDDLSMRTQAFLQRKAEAQADARKDKA